MKKLFSLVAVLLLACNLSVSAENLPTQDILEETLEQTENVQIPDFNFTQMASQAVSGTLSFSFEGVLETLSDILWGEIKENIAILIKILVLAVLAGVLCNLHQSAPGNSVHEISFLACFAAISGFSVTIISDLSQLASVTMDNMMLFIASLMPVIGGLVASTSELAMTGFYPTLFLAMQAFTAICSRFFLPAITVITALSVINAMSGRFHIARLIAVLRQIIKWSIGLLLTVFVGILSIHSFSAFAAGSVAGRTVKYALCNFVPLVGNVLAESAEAVISSVRVIRGAVGLTGVLALLFLTAIPLIKMLTVSLLYRFAAGISEPATDQRIVKLLMDLAGNITLIFSILLMVSAMFIISIALLCSFHM